MPGLKSIGAGFGTRIGIGVALALLVAGCAPRGLNPGQGMVNVPGGKA